MKKLMKSASAVLAALMLALYISDGLSALAYGGIGGGGAGWRPRPKAPVRFDADSAIWRKTEHGTYGIDLSNVDKGPVVLSLSSDAGLRLWVRHGNHDAIYAVPGDGSVFSVPLPYGSGDYEVHVLEHVDGRHYRYAATVPVDAYVQDQASPFSYAGLYVPFEASDACVVEAVLLADRARSLEGFVASVERFVHGRLEYDEDYVPGPLSAHVIDPDASLRAGKGICLDYAALVAAMLRSQGVP